MRGGDKWTQAGRGAENKRSWRRDLERVPGDRGGKPGESYGAWLWKS